MDSQLQQAVVAARAGEYPTARLLLATRLQQSPGDSDAWFLLAHLVEPPERQAHYLALAHELDPDNPLIEQHLQQLRQPVVPPPVFNKSPEQGEPIAEPITPPPEIDSQFVPIPPARTNAVQNVSAGEEALSTTPPLRPSVVNEADSKRIDVEWQKTAGSPKRGSGSIPPAQPKRAAASQAVPPPKPSSAAYAPAAVPSQPKRAAQVAPPPAAPSAEPRRAKSAGINKWLLIILFVLVVIAFFFLSFLAYTMFFQ